MEDEMTGKTLNILLNKAFFSAFHEKLMKREKEEEKHSIKNDVKVTWKQCPIFY